MTCKDCRSYRRFGDCIEYDLHGVCRDFKPKGNDENVHIRKKNSSEKEIKTAKGQSDKSVAPSSSCDNIRTLPCGNSPRN